MRVEDLDGAVLAAIADVVCLPERAGRLARRHQWPPTAEVIAAWRNFILRDHDIARTYAFHLIDHVDVYGPIRSFTVSSITCALERGGACAVSARMIKASE